MNDLTGRGAWNLDEHRFDPHAPMRDKLRFALQYAVLAPSSHNTQPWHFIVEDESVTLCADRFRALPVADPFDRELIISCGAALFNLRVALNHFGLAYAITLFPSSADPDLLAQVRIVPNGHHDASLAPLFTAIPARVTTREPFDVRPVAGDVQRRLIEAGQTEGAQVLGIEAPVERLRIADLVEAADQVQFADSRFRRELACWIHPQRRGDGMPAYAAGMSALLDFAVPIAASVVRTFDVGAGMAAMHQRLVEASPLVMAIVTGTDDREAWLAAGQALERLLLCGVNDGLSGSYLNQPIEVAPLRERLRTILGTDGVPQLLLRIGYGPQVGHAPRRPLADVLW